MIPPGLPMPKSTEFGPRDWSMRSTLKVSAVKFDLKKLTEIVPPVRPRIRIVRVLLSLRKFCPAPPSSPKSYSVLTM
ncbi:MAG: hypothetical protein RLZZ221_2656 [Verrucomicrobiota bacterium]